MNENDRREFIKKVAIGSAVFLTAPHVYAAKKEDDKKIFSKFFRVEIQGMYGEVPGVTEVDPGRVKIKTQELKQANSTGPRKFAYGGHEYDDFTMTLQQSPTMAKLQKWVDKAMKKGGNAKALRRKISIHVLARDKKTVLRTINCFGCYPVNLNAGDHGTSSEIKTITITCNLDRIEVA
ncbi:MAG: hypothetical protein GY847_33570 [Proteobacteria bacterium]|nr:hypothetical protein [Pseudomonadota bacterium]